MFLSIAKNFFLSRINFLVVAVFVQVLVQAEALCVSFYQCDIVIFGEVWCQFNSMCHSLIVAFERYLGARINLTEPNVFGPWWWYCGQHPCLLI